MIQVVSFGQQWAMMAYLGSND